MEYNTTCLGACTPPQIVNFNVALNDISNIQIFNDCGCEYDTDKLEYAYSLDGLSWSCYMSYKDILTNVIELNQDYYVRVKVAGPIGGVTINGEKFTNYSTELVGCFQFTAEENSSTYNPYANMDSAISLYQQLSESVSQMVGIPAYYIKLNPNAGSKDLTFKEYALMNVESVKQIKIVIADNQMPSSKPEFNDWGLDWQTDWEVEITKGTFATAFGNTAKPMEGDLVYIPMMKRMWMVNGAYEEKRDGFMWIATTFKVALVKYQEKDSVDLGDTQSFVDTLVKNKYEDLFGEDSESTLDSGESSLEAPKYAANTLYPVYESDATRKYVTCDSLVIEQNDVYFKGTLISDSKYTFLRNDVESKISYQKKYCGDEIAISFLIFPQLQQSFNNSIITIGNIKIMIEQNLQNVRLYLNCNKNVYVDLTANNWFFVIFKWNKSLNSVDATAYRYTHKENIPLYKLGKQHYYFDIDNIQSHTQHKFNNELIVTEKTEVCLNNFYGSITNFKLFDLYNDNVSELLRMYPTHQHLLINDTARKIIELRKTSI